MVFSAPWLSDNSNDILLSFFLIFIFFLDAIREASIRPIRLLHGLVVNSHKVEGTI